jgi:hypothetical protein
MTKARELSQLGDVVTVDAGNVGIGTTSPSSILHARGPGNPTFTLSGSDGAYTSVIQLTAAGAGGSVINANGGAGAFMLQTNGTERMRIDASGNVGIGTATPTNKLHLSLGNASGDYASYGGTDRWANGLNKIAIFRHGYWAGGNEVASIGVQTTSTTSGSGYGLGSLVFHTGSGGNGDAGSTSAERMRIDASGNVGIGTASPAAAFKLDVNGAFTVGGDYDAGTSTNGGGVNIGFNTTGGGNITALNPGVSWYPLALAGSEVKFSTLGAERARFDSIGNLSIAHNTANPIGSGVPGLKYWTDGTLQLSAVSKLCAEIGRAGSAGNVIDFYQNAAKVGSISLTTNSTAYITSSDPRLKENITPIQGASDIVMALNPVTYTFKADGSWMDGFLTTEVQTLLPSAVVGEPDAMKDEDYEVSPAVLDDEGEVVTEAVTGTRSVPDYQGMDYSRLTPILTASLQDALRKIDALTARIETLEAPA